MNWRDRVLVVLFGLVTGTLVCILTVAAITVGVSMYQESVDTEGVPTIDGTGTVVGLTHTPARWQPIMIGRTVSGYWVPATYRVRVQFDGWCDSVSVSSTCYDSLSIGEEVHIEYQVGHSGTHYLRMVYY